MEENKVLTGDFNKEEEVVMSAEMQRVMSKKINVENFCKAVDRLCGIKVPEGKENENLKKYIEGHIINGYVSYADKCDQAKRLIEATYYTSVGSVDEVRVFKQNSPALNMLKCLVLIDMYTDIEIRFQDHSVDDFDELAKRGLIEVLLSSIPGNEVEVFDGILEMMIEDVYENERSVVGMVEGVKMGISKVIGGIWEMVQGEMEKEGINWRELVG